MNGDRHHFWRAVTCLALAVVTLTSGLRGAGEFRCRLGMAEAGPECPVCHGSNGPAKSSAFSEPCCEFVAGAPSPSVVLTAGDPLPAPSADSLLPALPHLEPTLRLAGFHEVANRDVGPPGRTKPLFLRL